MKQDSIDHIWPCFANLARKIKDSLNRDTIQVKDSTEDTGETNLYAYHDNVIRFNEEK